MDHDDHRAFMTTHVMQPQWVIHTWQLTKLITAIHVITSIWGPAHMHPVGSSGVGVAYYLRLFHKARRVHAQRRGMHNIRPAAGAELPGVRGVPGPALAEAAQPCHPGLQQHPQAWLLLGWIPAALLVGLSAVVEDY